MENKRIEGQNILVLGGTGAMGVYLVDLLAKAGASVFVTSRREMSDTRANVSFLKGNAHAPSFMKECVALSRPAAVVDFMNYKTTEFSERAAFLCSCCEQYVFLSSYSVFADDVPVRERSPRLLDTTDDAEFLATDIYPLAKARQENEIRKHSKGKWTIVRPAITYSTERFQFGCLEANTVCYRSFQGIPVVIPEAMLDKMTTLTWGGDVAAMILGLLLNPDAVGEDFNVATAECRTWRQIASIYEKAIGLRFRPCSLDEYERIIGEHYHYQILFDRMLDRKIDNTKILSATGLDPTAFTLPETGIPKELAVFRRRPYYPFLNVPENARMDVFCGSSVNLSSLSEEERQQYLETVHDFECSRN